MPATTVEHDFASWRRSSDTQALSRVFDALAPELLVVANHVAGQGSAEDLVQGTFLQAIQHAERWDATRRLLPWLVGILVRLALRERERQRRTLDPERLARPATPDPQDVAATEELATKLGEALHELPLPYRQTLTLRLVHGLEPTAIAHALGAPVATIKSRLQRGMELLRRHLPAGLGMPALAIVTPRSLAEVKTVVLGQAAKVTATVAATATVTGAGIGAMLVMNKMTVTLVAGLALTGALALAWLPSGEPRERQEVPVAGEPTDATGATPADTPAAPTDAATRQPQRSALAVPEAEVETAPRLIGRVVDEAGAGLPDVTVFLALPGRASEFSSESAFLLNRCNNPGPVRSSEGGAVTQTAADGSFAFARPDDAMHRVLLAWSPQRGCKLHELEDNMTAPIVIELRQGWPLSGAVRSSVDRSPIEGARVSIYPEKSSMPMAWVPTDARGRYTSPPLPVQGYRVQVQAPGFALSMVRAAAGERTMDIELTPQPVLRATLVDAAGVAWTATRIEAVTGSAKDLHFLLTRRGYERLSELGIDAYEPTNLRFDGDTGRLEGSIIDPEARVLSVWRGAEKLGQTELPSLLEPSIAIALAAAATVAVDVNIRFDPPPKTPVDVKITIADTIDLGTGLMPLRVVETRDARASLAVPEHFAGRACVVLVEAAGYVEHFALLTVPEDGSGAWHEALLQPGVATLRGRVLGPDRRPPISAKITVVNLDGSPLRLPSKGQAFARDDGEFVFEGLPHRRVWLMVAADGCAPRGVEVDTTTTGEVEVELAASRIVKVVFPRSVKTRLRVLDAAGRPLRDDRLTGSACFGNGLPAFVDAQAVTIEAYDALTGELMDRGAIPASGDLELDDGR